MSKKLLELVEVLREAGQHGCDIDCRSNVSGQGCNCVESEHNSRVDAAAKALVAEIEGKPRKKCILERPGDQGCTIPKIDWRKSLGREPT
jgi:hypothetical protein